MRALGMALLLGGYTLVYAAVARGGMFALEPWLGLLEDAYQTAANQSPGAGAPVPGP